MDKDELLKNIANVIEKDIKPFIESNNGQIELEDFNESTNTVFISLAGACAGGSKAPMYTHINSIENIFKDKISQDIKVEIYFICK